MMIKARVAVARAAAIWGRAIVEGCTATLGRTLTAVSVDNQVLESKAMKLRHMGDDVVKDRCTWLKLGR